MKFVITWVLYGILILGAFGLGFFVGWELATNIVKIVWVIIMVSLVIRYYLREVKKCG